MKKKTKINKVPALFKGNLFLDNRGILGFNNDLDLSKIKRFYTIQNYRPNFIRAWHGHFKEEKFFMVVKGTAIVIALPIRKEGKEVYIDSRDPFVTKVTLSESVPNVFYIPGGFANGAMTLTEDTKILIFSTSSLEDSKADDYRIELNQTTRDLFEVEEQ